LEVQQRRFQLSLGGFAVEDAIERGAADAQLAGGLELVAVIHLEDEMNMAMDHCIEIKDPRWLGGVRCAI